MSPGATSGVVAVVPCPVTPMYGSELMLASVCSGGFAAPMGSMPVIELMGTGGTVMSTLVHAGSCAFSFSVRISHPERCVEYEYPVLTVCDGVFGCGEALGSDPPAGGGTGFGEGKVFCVGAGAGLGTGGRGGAALSFTAVRASS